MNIAYSYSRKKSNETIAAAHDVAQRRAMSLADNRPSPVAQLMSRDGMRSHTHTASQGVFQFKANSTGLPDNLKAGIENLSGHSMNDVKVHYHSSKPAQLNAHAYAQGNQIHVASGQEKHLPHEAWHVVQQKQGRVRPTMQMKGKVNVNDDSSLEKEADVMGAKAVRQAVQMQRKEQPALTVSEATAQLRYNPVNATALRTSNFYTTSHSTVQRATATWVNGAAVAAIPGDRAAANAGYTVKKAATKGAADYIKATHYDGPFPTPTKELITQMDNHYEGKNTGLAAPNDKVPALTANKTLLSSPLNATYLRPFSVEARTSAVRGKGRSNTSGIETNIGYMGRDEAMLHGKFVSFQGGHLVGDQIMDSHGSFLLYEDWNLAPQHSHFNAPIYLTTMENAAARAIQAGADLEYNVNVQYPDNTYNIMASVLANTVLWFGGFGAAVHYGDLIKAAILNGEPDNALTFTRRTPGYWKANMKDLNAGQVIDSSVRNDVMGAYDGTVAGVAAAANYNPAGFEVFRYTAHADGALMGPLVPPNNVWNIAGADSLTLETRQETY